MTGDASEIDLNGGPSDVRKLEAFVNAHWEGALDLLEEAVAVGSRGIQIRALQLCARVDAEVAERLVAATAADKKLMKQVTWRRTVENIASTIASESMLALIEQHGMAFSFHSVADVVRAHELLAQRRPFIQKHLDSFHLGSIRDKDLALAAMRYLQTLLSHPDAPIRDDATRTLRAALAYRDFPASDELSQLVRAV